MNEKTRAEIINLLSKGDVISAKEYLDVLKGEAYVVRSIWDLMKLTQSVNADGTKYVPKSIVYQGGAGKAIERCNNDMNAIAEELEPITKELLAGKYDKDQFIAAITPIFERVDISIWPRNIFMKHSYPRELSNTAKEAGLEVTEDEIKKLWCNYDKEISGLPDTLNKN